MSYQLLGSDPLTGGPAAVVRRIEDGAFVPLDPENPDFQAYLAWLAAGNLPQPAAG